VPKISVAVVPLAPFTVIAIAHFALAGETQTFSCPLAACTVHNRPVAKLWVLSAAMGAAVVVQPSCLAAQLLMAAAAKSIISPFIV
jgi:hypothetical protein